MVCNEHTFNLWNDTKDETVMDGEKPLEIYQKNGKATALQRPMIVSLCPIFPR